MDNSQPKGQTVTLNRALEFVINVDEIRIRWNLATNNVLEILEIKFHVLSSVMPPHAYFTSFTRNNNTKVIQRTCCWNLFLRTNENQDYKLFSTSFSLFEAVYLVIDFALNVYIRCINKRMRYNFTHSLFTDNFLKLFRLYDLVIIMNVVFTIHSPDSLLCISFLFAHLCHFL